MLLVERLVAVLSYIFLTSLTIFDPSAQVRAVYFVLYDGNDETRKRQHSDQVVEEAPPLERALELLLIRQQLLAVLLAQQVGHIVPMVVRVRFTFAQIVTSLREHRVLGAMTANCIV